MMPMLHPELSAAEDPSQQGLFERLLELAGGERSAVAPATAAGDLT